MISKTVLEKLRQYDTPTICNLADDGSYAWLEERVRRFEALPEGVVVVQQDLDGPKVAATFGEVM